MGAPEIVRLTTFDGVPIVGEYWPADDRALAFVVAQGFTGSSRTPRVTRISNQLAATGAAVLAIDFRGHARSGGQSSLGQSEVCDRTAAVAQLRGAGDAAVAVLGWSMVGSVALRYAGLGHR